MKAILFTCIAGVIAFFIITTGCVSQLSLRVSSSTHLTKEKQMAVFSEWPQQDLEGMCKELMKRNGLNLIYAVDAPNGSRVLVFKGRRENLISLQSSSTMVRVDTYEIGSWFALRLSNHNRGSQITMFGKPTIRGTAVCSEDDVSLADVQYWCVDTKVREDFARRDLVNGKIEADFIGAFLENLKDLSKALKPLLRKKPGVIPI